MLTQYAQVVVQKVRQVVDHDERVEAMFRRKTRQFLTDTQVQLTPVRSFLVVSGRSGQEHVFTFQEWVEGVDRIARCSDAERLTRVHGTVQ